MMSLTSPGMLPASPRLHQQLTFILEIDRLKQVLRQTLLTDGSRRENDAEHSWHLAMMAIVLQEYAAQPVDLLRVLKMLLIHDLVEIDAGDTFCYDEQLLTTKADREQQAADRLFGLLPIELQADLYPLWQEFEARETADAQFAAALDLLQPILHNYQTQGHSWQKNQVTADQVRRRAQSIGVGAPVLGDYVEVLLQAAIDQGYLLDAPVSVA
ncbi:HD domain-containing protein [Alkalinema pantanalense CENA528]|uniref:HD domain-containing protein n=1 Tax=Alkalinema pantanalense TaxID=1620705 RepID=UPI003D6EE87E